MRNRNKKFSNEQGSSALLMSVMVLFSTLAIILAISDVIRSRIDTNRTQINSAKAYFAAEAGAERALWEIRKNGCSPDGSTNCFVFAGCSHAVCGNLGTEYPLPNLTEYRVEDGVDGADIKLTCYGSYSDVSRAVELRF
jgi:hypothetical protein